MLPGAADEDGDNRISEQEFVNVLSKPEAVTALTSLGVDVDAALDYGPELSCASYRVLPDSCLLVACEVLAWWRRVLE